MAKNNLWFVMLLVIGVVGYLIISGKIDIGLPQSVTGVETMTRTVGQYVLPSSTFSITYTAVGTSGTWGASIEDSVTGGCTFPSGSSTYKTVMLSEDGNTKTITITAPSSGSCTFSGDYMFGSFAIQDFTDKTITVCQPMTCLGLGYECGTHSDGCGGTISCGTCADHYACSGGSCVCVPDTCTSLGFECGIHSDGCGGTISCGTCADHYTCNLGTCECVPDCTDWSAENSCAETMSDGCGGTCTRTVDRDIYAPTQDTNCDGGIDRDELSVAIVQYLNDNIDRSVLGGAIQSWAAGG